MSSLIFFLYKIAGGLITPPGCFFVFLFLLPFRAMRRAEDGLEKRASRRLLLIAALMYVLFMPVTAEFLMGLLETTRPVLPDDDRPTVVAVLAGGGTHPVPGSADSANIELAEQSFQRLAAGVNAAKRRRWPLIYSGAYDEGDPAAYEASLRAQAVSWGFRDEMLVEMSSRTTWENMREIALIARERGYERVVLSTTAYHMKRSLWMAERQMPGIEVIPWPSGWRSTRDGLALNAFAPSARAFYDSCAALRELVGLLAYRLWF